MKICRARPQLVFTFDNRFSSTVCAVQQSVRYIIFRLQASVCYQPHRQEVMPGQKSIYETFLVFPLPPLSLTCTCRRLPLWRRAAAGRSSSQSPSPHSEPARSLLQNIKKLINYLLYYVLVIPYWECNIKQRNSLFFLIAVAHVRVREANFQDGEKSVNVVFKGTQAWDNSEFFLDLNQILICPS